MKIKTWRRIQLQFHTITMSSRKKQKQKQKATGELKLKHIYMRTLSSYYRKRLKCFLKGDRGGRVDDFGAQGVVKFRSLVKNKIVSCIYSTAQKIRSGTRSSCAARTRKRWKEVKLCFIRKKFQMQEDQNSFCKKPEEVTSPTTNHKYPQEVCSCWLNQQCTELEPC